MAKQMILSFDVENQTLKRKDENKIVEKSKNYVHAIFFFTEEWDDTQKAAIIENGGMRFKVYLENNECDIPNRAVSHDGFTITIVGEDEEKNITITTTDLFIAVQKNNASDIQEEYIKNITSDTLDITRNGENCNIEIPSEYVTDEKLSQELENYVDNESLEETLEDYAKETDLSDYATKQELNGKSTIIPNPTMSGDEPTLEGAEIDGIKYKVGGGGKLYLHKIIIKKSYLYNPAGSLIGTDLYVFYSIVTSNNTPITFNEFMTMVSLSNYGYHYGTNVSGDITISSNLRALNSFSSYSSNTRAEISYIDSNAVLKYTNCVFDSVDSFADTITEV